MGKRRKHNPVRWFLWSGLVLLLGVAAAGTWWWYTGRLQIDSAGVRLVTGEQLIREITWTKPLPVEPPSSADDEYEAAVSPDGTEMYLVRQTRQGFADIFVSHRRNNAWTEPQPVAAINSAYDEMGPRVTADGAFLLFCSERPGGQGRYDLWAAPRVRDGWGEPFNLGPQLNSPYDDHSPALTPDGRRLFFSSNRNDPPDAWGGKVRQNATANFDLFMADSLTTPGAASPATPASAPPQPALAFAPPRPLAEVNTRKYDGSCSVSPRGDFLCFTSNRPGGFGGYDIYRAPLLDGRLGKAENLGQAVNTIDNEADPALTNGGFTIYFSSDRPGARGGDDLFTSDSREIFVKREPPKLPKLGRNGWLLLGAAGLFFPLLVVSRSTAATMLQKCIVLSLMFHLLLVMMFSGVRVSQAVVTYVKQELGMEIPINLAAAHVAEVQYQVRNQVTDIAAPPDAANIDVPRFETHTASAAEAPLLAVDVPRMAAQPGQMSIAAPSPMAERPVPGGAPTEQIAIAPPDLQPILPDITFRVPEPVRQPDDAPQRPAPQPELTRIEPKLTVTAEQISLGAVPMRPDTAVPGDVVAATNTGPPLPGAVESGMQVNVEINPSIILPRVDVPSTPPGAEETRIVEAPVAPPRQSTALPGAAVTPQIGVPRLSADAVAGTTPADPLAGRAVEGAIAMDLSPQLGSIDIRLPTIDMPPPRLPDRPPPTSAADVIPVARPRDARPLPQSNRNDLLRPAESLLPVDPVASAIDLLDAGLRQALESGVDPAQANPQVSLLTGPIGPRDLFTTETLAQRAKEQREQALEELGGNRKTEDAVNLSLAWLARNQQADGRWTRFSTPRSPARDRDAHDIALTSLATLCFLGTDNTPTKEGPYRETVRKGVEFILAEQERSGDLRGRGNMYDHAMATIALSEAAFMTNDMRYRTAAFKAADYIVRAQREDTGGWQYAPGEFGDTSVLGWCLLALHSAERGGYKVPPRTYQAAAKWFDRVTTEGTLLAGYQNKSPATPAMTAKNIFGRILLGQPLDPRAVRQASEFIASLPPGSEEKDHYYWYYASLSLMQLQNDTWTRWNLRCRDYLVATQRLDGDAAGSWDVDGRWTDRGGRVYTTAMATLTLEVYYRYIPLYHIRGRPQ